MKKYLHKTLYLLLTTMFCFLHCFSLPSFAKYPGEYTQPQQLPFYKVKLGQNELNIMIAHNDFQKAKGLMFYNDIASNTGMLFVYKEPRKLSFWMMNTKIPLDLIFFSENLEVTEWVENMIPGYGRKANNLPSYKSLGKAQYALELKSGSIKELGIKIGDKLEIPLILLYSE